MGIVTLIDGRQVDSWSEDWRQECEARAILAMPTKEQRQKHLEWIQFKRSPVEAQRLKDIILQIWNAKRA